MRVEVRAVVAVEPRLLDAATQLFLAEIYRLHPDIARCTSKVSYEGKVEARPGLERQAIVATDKAELPFTGSGLLHAPVPHTGSQPTEIRESGIGNRNKESLPINDSDPLMC